jgi:peptidoglycan/LPS O-acetylase OafA/YrhL
VWLIGGAGLANVTAVLREPDYGISLVWFAGAGVLATALGKRAWPGLRPAYRGLLLVAAAAALLTTILFDSSGHYEHAVALPLSALVVLVMWRDGSPTQGRDSARAPSGRPHP